MKDLADITMGQSPAGSSMNERTGMEFHQGKTNFGSVFLNCSKVKTNAPTKMANKDDIVICVRAPVGVVNITNRKICIGRGLAALSPKELVDRDYLFYALQASQKAVEKLAAGSTFSSIPGPELCKLELPKQTYEKQKSIGRALSSADKAIAILEKQISKYENIKKSTKKMLLTPKPGWKKFLLGDICDVSGAGVDKKIHPNEERVILLNYLDVYHKTYVHKSGLDHVVSAKAKQKNRCSVRKNDIFFTPSSETPDDIAKSCVAMEDMQDVAYSYHIIRARPKIPCNSLFVKYACSTHDFFAQAETACVGSGKRYVISLSKFREFSIFVPEIAEQNIIAKSLYDMDMQIEQLKQQLAKVQKVKQGMMSYFFG